MKTQIVASVLLSLAATSAFADSSKIVCEAVRNSKHQISVAASSKSDDSRLVITIDGHKARIDNNQQSNDMSIDIQNAVTTKDFGVTGTLTSDDATDVFVYINADLDTLKLSEGSTNEKGSAEFVANINAEIDKYQKRAESSTQIAKVDGQLVSCKSSWSSDKKVASH